eukprot:2389859-Pleurochrysis_carterae.AAC.1
MAAHASRASSSPSISACFRAGCETKTKDGTTKCEGVRHTGHARATYAHGESAARKAFAACAYTESMSRRAGRGRARRPA